MEIKIFNSKTKKFFEALNIPLRPKILKAFELLEKYENALGMPYSKSLGGGLFELRIIGTVQIRFLYGFHNNQIWILHGFIKKTRRLPKGDIEYARKQIKALALI